MTFFNQKEEVLQVELTQYGKHLLSKGKMKPVYYAFYDDDVIYDGAYAGINENNGTAVERIKSTPRTKTQHVFTGIEEQVKKNLELIKQGKENLDSLKLIPTTDKHHVLNKRLGNSFLGDIKLPSLNVGILKGEIQSTILTQTGSISEIPLQKTPLFQMKDIDYVIKAENPGSTLIETEDKKYISTYPDGTAISLTEDYLLIQLIEKNVENEMKNFDIEIFECLTNEETGEETFVQLHFDQRFEDYKNGILLDQEMIDNETKDYLTQQRNSDQFRVENYFNIMIDQEIDKNLVCKLINNMSQGNTLYDPMFDCSDYENVLNPETTSTNRQQQIGQATYSTAYTEDDVESC